MKVSSFLTLSSLLWAGTSLAANCRPSRPASSSSLSSSASASASSAVSPVSASSSVSSSVPSSASSSAPAASSSAGTGSLGSAPPTPPACSTQNIFVDGDLLLGLDDWPHDLNLGSPTYALSTSCTSYAACIEIGLVGGAENIDFYQDLVVVQGTSYSGYFYYRLPSLTANGKSMATLTCTVNGVQKFSSVLCADDTSVNWKKVSFSFTATSAEEVFKCKVSTTGVKAEFQFTDFYAAANC